MKWEIKISNFIEEKILNSLQKENRALEVGGLVAFKDVEKEKNDLQKDLSF